MRRVTTRYYCPDIICLVLASLLFTSSILEAKAGIPGAVQPGQAETAQKPTLKERILEVPPGTMIEVKLLNKQKIRGRLGEVADASFTLTSAQGEKVASQKIAFTDVKSFKKVEGGKAGRAVLYALAGIGAAFLVIVIVFASKMD